jgi:DNA recombination protein RmuC
MNILPQLSVWQQLELGFGLLSLVLLILALQWLWLLRKERREDAALREAQREYIEQLLWDQERSALKEQSDLRDVLSERIVRGALAQQRTLQGMQQSLQERSGKLYQGLERRFGEMQQHLTEDAGNLRVDLVGHFESLRKNVSEGLAQGRLSQQEALQKGIETVRKEVAEALDRHAESLGKRVESLAETTDQRLKEISGQVERRLSEGFEKTTETFTQVLTHLTRIDEAQKRITELSSNVVSLQEVLSDKRSRGAFGEVQLHALVRNVMPESGFALQHSLSNGRRADCVMFLPEPTGNVVIDAKFPLESYQRMQNHELAEGDRALARRQFRQDIKKHIDDIAGRYIIPGETSDGAVMFIPAEAVFAEIHAGFPELVEEAFRRRVWLVSPTTMMAILTTARAVLKDAATREQVHIIQQHLRELSKDFGRFQTRMEKLASHISQAHNDVNNVNISARKITGRFEQIEQVELDEKPGPDLPVFRQNSLGEDRRE